MVKLVAKGLLFGFIVTALFMGIAAGLFGVQLPAEPLSLVALWLAACYVILGAIRGLI